MIKLLYIDDKRNMGKLEAHFIFYVKTLKKWLTLYYTHDIMYSEQRKQPKHSEEDKVMTDLEKVLKNSLNVNYKKTEEVCKQFCCNTIILTAETFERVSKNYSESNGNIIKKIYKVEVVIDGRTVFEHYGKNADEMNKQYLVALDMCQG